jgi:tetratricopeptide (TPR) repeat protein/transglutaminase-like putative cysteine protease
MVRLMLVVVCAFLAIGPARADDVLHFGQPPSWVAELAAPAAKPADGAFTIRLFDFQVRFDDKGAHQFVRQIIRINTPEGLQVAGTVIVPWQPGVMSATVNRVVIHRGSETIDVMKDGKSFQILRRESGLESAMISGVLTAVLPVPDLRVGDEIEVAFTLDLQNPVLAGHAEIAMPLDGLFASDRLAIRYSWPVDRKVRWLVGPALPASVMTKAGGFQTLSITRDSWTPPEAQAGAPARFKRNALIQVADFSDWASVRNIMRPLFAKASTLGSGSPVMAEVKRIAAMSPDLKVRASEALRVVQSQVRYLARVDGLGGYVPESADAVWAAKSGDCKGKTVLLLAMLRALGVTAEPALVSATDGDGLDASIPMPGRFNHVIARATIEGKDYWLDGTRLGDRGVDAIAVPGFKWALPLDGAATGLVALVATEPALAETETRLDFDARAGMTKPAKASGSVTYRGETGSTMRVALTMANAAQRDEYLRSLWKRYSWITVDSVASAIDDKSGDVVLSFTGTAKLDWSASGADNVPRYEADNARLGRDLAPKRDKGGTAPVAVDGDYTVARETILLSEGGKGFEVEGESFDRVIGGVRYVRTASIKDGKFEMSASSRTKPFELSYADAQEADKLTDGLIKKQLFIRAPQAFAAVADGAPEVAAGQPSTDAPDASLAEVTRLSVAGDDAAALKVIDGLIAKGDKAGKTLSLRAQLLRRLGRTDEASMSYDQALAANRREPLAIIGKAEILIEDGREDDALILLDRLVLLWPDTAEAYRRRASARFDVGDVEGTLADIEAVVAKTPDDIWARTTRANLYQQQGKPDAAVAEARALVALKADEPEPYVLLGTLLARQGKRAAAIFEIDKSIALKPTAEAYSARIQFGLSANGKALLSDMVNLIKLNPYADPPGLALRRLLADPAAQSAIKQAYSDAIEAEPNEDLLLVERDRTLAIGGEVKPYLARLDAALAKKPADADLLNEACWGRAVFKLELDTALAQCDRSISGKRRANVLDSRGLVRLQRGEWKEAAADYGDAVAARPMLANSLYGRGIARKRLGDLAGSKADIDAALRIDPTMADRYAFYGITP